MVFPTLSVPNKQYIDNKISQFPVTSKLASSPCKLRKLIMFSKK